MLARDKYHARTWNVGERDGQWAQGKGRETWKRRLANANLDLTRLSDTWLFGRRDGVGKCRTGWLRGSRDAAAAQSVVGGRRCTDAELKTAPGTSPWAVVEGPTHQPQHNTAPSHAASSGPGHPVLPAFDRYNDIKDRNRRSPAGGGPNFGVEGFTFVNFVETGSTTQREMKPSVMRKNASCSTYYSEQQNTNQSQSLGYH
ncbi:hypothetical protein VTK26DRAFT_6763 [Humicola hyalothermophila]